MNDQNFDTKATFFKNPIVLTITALICCALWGSATPAIKTGSKLLIPQGHVPSTMLFAGIRFFMAGIITVIIYSIARRKFLFPKKENLHFVGILSCFQTIIQYIFFYVGLSNTSGVKGTIMSGTATFFAIIISCFIFRMEKFNATKLVACILGFAGIIVINLSGLEFKMNFTGDCFVIFSAISLAVSSVLAKRFSKYEDPVVLSGYQFILGGAVMIAIGLIAGGKISFTDTVGVIILIYLAFLSAIAYSLWGVLLKYNPVSKVTVFSFTTPVFGTVLSLLLLTEKSNVGVINLISALLLVSAGILLLNYKKLPKPSETLDK